MKRPLTILILIELLGFFVLQAQSSIFQGATARLGRTISTQAPPFPGPLVISTVTLPAGDEGVSYSESLASTGGTAPFEWALNAGSDPLPPGLLLSPGGVISGTPTAAGDYPFTVRVTDGQPVFQTKLLAIHINPAAPGGGVIFSSDGDDTGDMSVYVSAGGSSVTSTGLIDGNKEITKATATDTILADNIDAPEIFLRFDDYRDAQQGVGPATNRYEAVVALDSAGNVLFRYGIEMDWDVFARIPGQTTFPSGGEPRGFFLQPIAPGTSKTVQLHYKKGTINDALFEARVDGGAAQSFNEGTPAANVDRVIFRQHNDNANQTFVRDRIKIRTDTWEPYMPPVPVPPPPPPSGTCLNQACVTQYTVPSGSDRGLFHVCAAEGADRDTASVSSSVDGSLTKVASHDANGCHVSIWVKDDPTVGAHTVTASFPGGSDAVEASCQSVALSGISSLTAQATATDSEASASSISTNITTTTTDAVIISGLCGVANGSATPGSGQVEVFDSPGGAGSPGMFGAGSSKSNNGAAGSKAFSYTASASMALTAVGAAFPIPTAVQGSFVTSAQGTPNYGCTCNGSTNTGSCLQTALSDEANWSNSKLVFPAGLTCVTGQKLTLSSSSGWTIEGQGSTIKAANGLSSSGVGLLNVESVTNFTINNLDLDGNRANRTLSESGGCDNYRFRNAKNGTIRDVDSRNACNDNVRVASTTPSNHDTFSLNLTFINLKTSNAYRNNVSVIEGDNIRFVGTCTPGTGGSFFAANATCTCQFTNANGTAPKAGLGYEPNPGSTVMPGTVGSLVEGCLFDGNRGSGLYASGSNNVREVTVRGNIFRDNGLEGGLTGSNDGGALGLKAHNSLVEANYIGVQAGSRFAVIYAADGNSTQYTGNFINGQPPVAQSNGSRRVLHCGNFGNGTTLFKNNIMTNIGVSASGDWCTPDTDTCGFGSTVEGNTVDAVVQTPNPGCP